MKTASIIAILATAGIASADTHTFDISGLEVDGGFGDNFFTMVHDFGFAGTVTNVAWDVNFETVGASWESEAQIAIDTDDDASFDADIDPGLFGAADAPGAFAYNGSISANTVSSNGLVYLTLYDTFDDAGIDHVYGAGSFVTVTYIPAPGAAALLGLGGLVAARRRR